MRAFLICAVLLLSSIACFAADSPFTGTWKLKPKQGESGKGVAKVDSDVHTFNVDETVWDEKGQATKFKLDAKFDGKDYPVSDNPDFDSASVRRVSTHEVKVTFKKAGKLAGKSDIRVSGDGKTTTLEFTDYSQTPPHTYRSLWQKQQP
jgi:hypothetical protein